MNKGWNEYRAKSVINAMVYAMETRDPYTRGHSERVGTYAVWLGQSLNLSRKKMQMLHFSCRLHDVGKIGIADKILLKPGKLTLEERAEIEMHPVYGAEILGDLRFIDEGMPVILHHHERYDGTGYPYGLKGEKIPLEVRIASIADAFDAMTSDRPYRKAMSMSQTLHELKAQSGGQFDPVLVKAFLKLVEAAQHVDVRARQKAA